jgi:hypothetical protein
MKTASFYIIKDIEVVFPDPAVDAYLDMNTVATDVAATKIGGRYYQTLSSIHWDGNRNGILDAPLTTKPWVQLAAGTGKSSQTVLCTLHYYYML